MRRPKTENSLQLLRLMQPHGLTTPFRISKTIPYPNVRSLSFAISRAKASIFWQETHYFLPKQVFCLEGVPLILASCPYIFPCKAHQQAISKKNVHDRACDNTISPGGQEDIICHFGCRTLVCVNTTSLAPSPFALENMCHDIYLS